MSESNQRMDFFPYHNILK